MGRPLFSERITFVFQYKMEAVRQIRYIRPHRELNFRRNRIYVCRERRDSFILLTENEFKRRYRLEKETARYIIWLIDDELRPIKNRRMCISSSLQVLVTLRFFAKGLFQEDNDDIHGISQKSVSNIVKKVSVKLASLLPDFVKYPDDLDKLKRDFHRVAGFPNVVGCIDCTHIKIKNPDRERPLLYRNRKGYYSLNVQVVNDAQGKIINLVARWRGSAHDARILDECSLKDKFENGEIGGVLLGDGGYPCRHHLLTPVLNPRTPAERRYNSSQIRTRTIVERLFGKWKAIFRALQIGMVISLDNAKAAVAVMAVIHNIRIMRSQCDIDSDMESSNSSESEVEEMPVSQNNIHNLRGSAFRA